MVTDSYKKYEIRQKILSKGTILRIAARPPHPIKRDVKNRKEGRGEYCGNAPGHARGIVRCKRNNLSKLFIDTASKKIYQKLFKTKVYEKAKIIMFYVSKNNEVKTHYMIKTALELNKKVCVPRVNKIKNRIDPIMIKDFGKDLTPGSFAILEPKKGKIVKKIDIIIAPGIAFDEKGYRLGWGKGYYDKFLENKGGIPKIGLAFDFQIIPKLPKDKHDVPMDMIITEKRIINQKLSRQRRDKSTN